MVWGVRLVDVAGLGDVVGRTGLASAAPLVVGRAGVTRDVVAVLGARVGVTRRAVACPLPAVVGRAVTSGASVTRLAGVERTGCGKLRRVVVAVFLVTGLERRSADAAALEVGVRRRALEAVPRVAGTRFPDAPRRRAPLTVWPAA